MKKTITLVLAVVLVLALTVTAFAIGSPTAPVAAPGKTTPLPEVLDHTCKCLFYSIYDADKLSEETQKMFQAAQESLKEATPDQTTVKYFFFHVKDPTLTDLCQHIFDIGEFEEITVKLYVDDEWVDLEELGKRMHTATEIIVNADSTITVRGLETAPVAFLTK